MVPFNSRKCQLIYREIKQISGCLEKARGGRGRLQRGMRKLLGMMDMLIILIVVIACIHKSKLIKFYI